MMAGSGRLVAYKAVLTAKPDHAHHSESAMVWIVCGMCAILYTSGCGTERTHSHTHTGIHTLPTGQTVSCLYHEQMNSRA